MIVIVEKDTTYFAYPYSCINTKSDLPINDWLNEDNLAFWKVVGKKNCILGGWSTMRINDVVRYEDNLLSDCEITLKDLVEKLQPRITDALEKAGEWNGEKDYWENAFFIAQNGKAFEVDFGYVREIDKFAVFERYQNLAMAVLDDTQNMPAMDRLHKIGKLVEEINAIPMFPMLVMDTKTQKLQVINEK